jgi:AcrR family transcriptional regulator
MPQVKKKARGRPRDEALAERRREEILEVATRLFAGCGFDATDLQEAADVLGVGKGTVYRYFPTKRDLFLAAVDRAMRLLSETVNGAAPDGGEPLEMMEAAVRAYLEFFDARPEFVELIIQERAVFKDRKRPTYFVHRDANMGRWEELFEGLVEAGVVRDVSIERLLAVLGDLLYGTMFTNFFTDSSRAPSEQAEDVLDVMFHGILTPKGVRERAARRRKAAR